MGESKGYGIGIPLTRDKKVRRDTHLSCLLAGTLAQRRGRLSRYDSIHVVMLALHRLQLPKYERSRVGSTTDYSWTKVSAFGEIRINHIDRRLVFFALQRVSLIVLQAWRNLSWIVLYCSPTEQYRTSTTLGEVPHGFNDGPAGTATVR